DYYCSTYAGSGIFIF
nr:immunoglobulin light chain junction region [Macaca mulatta]MOX28726.1 immunoglobulin light chain junction region [Macaca mulatta]MOX32612.1 immunoglobulin light chain junction region [Macaca mulatta]MOX32693.1 immunoglobulin light chain junction region [Macaca mulatta]